MSAQPPTGAPGADDAALGAIEVSFVLPCLNEAETLEGCIAAARRCIQAGGLSAEIVVADNGSTDGSREIAARCGARVVPVAERGYGSALAGGFAGARGRYLVMADADGSYDLAAALPFVERLRAGYDLVMGSRLRGRILPGAMPRKNRLIGNPVLSGIGRLLFRTPVSDFHCGMRALTRAAFDRLDLRTTGMEFASEMVVKASLQGMRIAEVPIDLHPDGRSRPPHLRPWRDGWRHLRFMLLLSPLWALFVPGVVLTALGLVLGALVAFGPLRAGSVVFDVHTLVLASLMTIVGYQAVTVSLAVRIYGLVEALGVPSPLLERAFRHLTFERGLVAGALAAVVGVGLIGRVAFGWAAAGFGPLDLAQTIRPTIVGATLAALGTQTILMSTVYSMLGIPRRGPG